MSAEAAPERVDAVVHDAVILDSDDDLSARFATFTPIWLHEAMESDAAAE